MGVGGVRFSGKKRYEGVMFNVISFTRGWVGVQFPEKKRYVTLKWLLTQLQQFELHEKKKDINSTNFDR